MTSNAIELHAPAALAIRPGQQMWSDKQVAALAVLGIKGASKADLAVFMHYCQKTGLDPFSKQIYGIMRRVRENGEWVDKFTIQTGIDGFRVIRDRVAERLGVTVEYEDTIWYDADGGEHKIWLWDDPPAGCNVTVIKDGRRFPGVLRFDSYAARNRDGDLVSQWKTQPDHMIEKCAEAFALRRAFPNDLAGVRLEDEMPRQDEGAPAVIRSRGRVTVAEVVDRTAAEPDDSGDTDGQEPPKASPRTARRKTAAAGDDTTSGSRHAAAGRDRAEVPDNSAGEGGRKSADPRAAGATSPRGAQPLPPLPGEDEVPGPEHAGDGTVPASAARGMGTPVDADDIEPDEAAEYGTERHAKVVGIVWAHLKRLGYPDDKSETDEEKADRLADVAKLAGVSEIGSTSDLDLGELSLAADTLAKCKNRARLDAILGKGQKAGDGDE